MIKKEKEPRDAARVLTNLRKCSGCRRGQGEGEGIESRFLLPLAFPSGRCLPNGRSMPPLSGRWQRIQRVVAHRKVNENSTPLHFSRASASSAINNCPPLIVHILLSLSLSLSRTSRSMASARLFAASSTNIQQRREKLPRILGCPIFSFGPLFLGGKPFLPAK